MTIIIETQRNETQRTYQIEGPRRETVEAFWTWLVEQRIIESYQIK